MLNENFTNRMVYADESSPRGYLILKFLNCRVSCRKLLNNFSLPSAHIHYATFFPLCNSLSFVQENRVSLFGLRYDFLRRILSPLF